MQTKSHLRQRHGSDALRLERFDRGDSLYDPDDNPLTSTSAPSTPPITKATHGPRLESSGHSRTRSSAYSNPMLVTNDNGRFQPSTSPSFSPNSPQHGASGSGGSYRPFSLPPGANSPAPDSQDVVTYPPPPATWMNMPNKGQLAILALSRFVDFFQMASLQTYMVHQLKSFDPSLPDSTISHQAGMLQGSFTAAQIITSILWGRAADQPGVGRKMVLNIGLVGTGISMLGVGFSSTYHQAVVWRVLGGAINGTVGSARTMVAEVVDKRWHPRAFLLLPAAFNVANVAGPSMWLLHRPG